MSAQAALFERVYTVRSELGMHARPAGRFVALAARFQAQVEVSREDEEEWVDGTSILSLLSLAASRGTRLRLRASGSDAPAAVEALGELIESPGEDREPAA